MSHQFYCNRCGGLFNCSPKARPTWCDDCRKQVEKEYQAEYYRGRKAELARLRAAIAVKDAEIERLKACRADAALGRAVRKMPAWTFIYRNSVGWFSGTEMSHGTRTYGPKADTPEAALEAAGLMEVEK